MCILDLNIILSFWFSIKPNITFFNSNFSLKNFTNNQYCPPWLTTKSSYLQEWELKTIISKNSLSPWILKHLTAFLLTPTFLPFPITIVTGVQCTCKMNTHGYIGRMVKFSMFYINVFPLHQRFSWLNQETQFWPPNYHESWSGNWKWYHHL